ncbi:MAG TPA: DUF72 domain-containing protein [Chitinophagaceae bacterium]|jgi:uncharacterized protein YecE (DUF72 family)|nr:DUF72 domain-containing protein [Chitinophagaceae bacterium]
MKFGTVAPSELSAIDFRLAAPPPENQTVLPGTRHPHPRLYLGSAHWGHPSWSGSVYPPKTPAARYRQLYPRHFSAMELNATHYTIYAPDVIRQWAAPAEGLPFRFCPKFPQAISHHSGFRQTEALTDAFLESITAFGPLLGPAFLQVSEFFAPAQREALFGYLSSLPQGVPYFLELRHPGWFSDARIRTELFGFLEENGIGLVLTDTPGRRDLVHQRLTVPRFFLRLVCTGTHPTSFARIDAWTARLREWIDLGLEEACLFLHPGDETAIPVLAQYWTEALNQQCGLQLPAVIKGEQGTLF